MDCGDGGRVHVVVVVVGDEHGVDGREIRETDSGKIVATRAEELEGTDAIRPDGVNEDVNAGGLNEKRGMSDAGDAEIVDA